MTSKVIVDKIVEWLKFKVKEAGAKGVVLGLSGGIDSAVTAVLAQKAFGGNMLALAMPIHSQSQDLKDAECVAEHFQLPLEIVELSDAYDSYIASIKSTEHFMAKSNIKPRMRMMTLYYYAQTNGYLVLGCSNLSEITVGYFTKYGDSGADLLPIADLLKSEIYELAQYLNIPENIINKKPSAGLWLGQSDEEELGLTYKELDNYIKGKLVSKDIEQKIKKMYNTSAHKRAFPPICKLEELK